MSFLSRTLMLIVILMLMLNMILMLMMIMMTMMLMMMMITVMMMVVPVAAVVVLAMVTVMTIMMMMMTTMTTMTMETELVLLQRAHVHEKVMITVLLADDDDDDDDEENGWRFSTTPTGPLRRSTCRFRMRTGSIASNAIWTSIAATWHAMLLCLEKKLPVLAPYSLPSQYQN